MRTTEAFISEKDCVRIIPVNIGREDCEPGHSFGPAVRSYWLLHFVAKGVGYFTTPRGKFTLGEGDIFVIRPYEVTFYQADTVDPWSYVWLGFEADGELPLSLLGNDVLHMPSLGDAFDELGQSVALRGGRGGTRELALSTVFRILSSLRLSEEGRKGAEESVEAAISIMKAEYSQRLTVGELAKRLHLNRQHLQRVFKESLGKTPGEFLTSLRMAKACELLKKGGYTLSVISASVGYSDPFVFSRAFKRYWGYTPGEYRRGLIG